MKSDPNVNVAEFDAEGKLVPLEGETPEETARREAELLHATGQSANHPDAVFPPEDTGDGEGGDGEAESPEVDGTETESSYRGRSRRRNREE